MRLWRLWCVCGGIEVDEDAGVGANVGGTVGVIGGAGGVGGPWPTIGDKCGKSDEHSSISEKSYDGSQGISVRSKSKESSICVGVVTFVSSIDSEPMYL